MLAGVVMLACAAPSSASGAVTIGETFTPPPAGACLGPITFVQSGSPESAYAVPSPGVLTSWSYQASTAVSPIKLKVATRVGAGSFRIEAESALETPVASTLNTYQLRIPVESGSVIGIYVEGAAGCVRFLPASGFEEHYLESDLLPGQTRAFTLDGCCYQLDVSARLEPDADQDGFGDETQDECPTDASEQVLCGPPETEITKAPANRSAKPEAKFKFTSSEPGSSFQCKLKGEGLKKSVKKYKDCDSPRGYKGLDEAKFRFSVRATDEAGHTDPSPAKDKFKVVGQV